MSSTSWEALAERPPSPEPDELTRFFWDGVAQHRLMIQRCSDCGQYIHPPLAHCRFCLSTDVAPAEVSGEGILDTFTIVMQPLHPYFLTKVPYNLSVVELSEQKALKMLTNIVDCDNDDLRVGMAVVVTFREVVPGLTLPLFRPA